jgi:uncharacterized protein
MPLNKNMTAIPHKILHTETNHYLYLPYNSRFYLIENGIMDELTGFLDSYDHAFKFTGSNHLRNFFNRYAEIPKAAESYQSFSYHNPVPTTGYREAVGDYLTSCVLCVTEQCNLRCSYCCYSDHYSQTVPLSNSFMSEATARQAVDFLYRHSRKSKDQLRLGFYGGEPMMLYPLIRNTVSYAKTLFKNNISFTMTTNATLLNQEKIDFLIDNEFGLLISLDGDQVMNDRHRKYWKKEGSVFQEVVESARMIRNTDQEYFLNKVRFNSVLSGSLDFAAMEKAFVEEIGSRTINVELTNINPRHTDFFEHYPEADQYDDDLAQARKRFYQSLVKGVEDDKNQSLPFYYFLNSQTIRINKRTQLPIDECTPFPTGQCVPVVFQMYVRPEGDIYLCEKVDGSSSVGNIRDGIDIEAVESLFEPYYEEAKRTCRHCWVQRLCTVCVIRCENQGRFDPEMKQQACKSVRFHFKQSMTDYLQTLEKNPEAFDFLESWSFK